MPPLQRAPERAEEFPDARAARQLGRGAPSPMLPGAFALAETHRSVAFRRSSRRRFRAAAAAVAARRGRASPPLQGSRRFAAPAASIQRPSDPATERCAARLGWCARRGGRKAEGGEAAGGEEGAAELSRLRGAERREPAGGRPPVSGLPRQRRPLSRRGKDPKPEPPPGSNSRSGRRRCLPPRGRGSCHPPGCPPTSLGGVVGNRGWGRKGI